MQVNSRPVVMKMSRMVARTLKMVRNTPETVPMVASVATFAVFRAFFLSIGVDLRWAT